MRVRPWACGFISTINTVDKSRPLRLDIPHRAFVLTDIRQIVSVLVRGRRYSLRASQLLRVIVHSLATNKYRHVACLCTRTS